MTFVVEINGKTKWIEISREEVKIIETVENLVSKLSKEYETDDVKFLGVCEA